MALLIQWHPKDTYAFQVGLLLEQTYLKQATPVLPGLVLCY
ncbi:hypothetical protein [Leptolyngbya sp. FACHB-261]|nr:hypothetical protein [Leptolyngbya sp. FACHB-261]